mgnify:CR=1 FL=1
MSIAEQQPKQLTIRQRLNQPEMKAEFARVLPRHCSAERMTRVALTAITRTPTLADCDQHSFFQALLNLSAWGLEPDGRRAHLIPFKNNKRGVYECQLIVDYKGLVELAYRSGYVNRIHADVVYEGDRFEYSLGVVEKHVPWFLRQDAAKPADRGQVIAVYCLAELKNAGAPKFELLTRQDVEAVRSRSRAGTSGPWVTDWNEMAKKTAFRRLSKWIPLTAEFRDAIDVDDQQYTDEPVEIIDADHPTAEGLLEQFGDSTSGQAAEQEPDEPKPLSETAERFLANYIEVVEAFNKVGDVNAYVESVNVSNLDAGEGQAVLDEVERVAEQQRETIRGKRGPRSNGSLLPDDHQDPTPDV